jgi:periplasmic protein TonB
MNRLVIAAVLAAGLHVAVIWVAGPRTRPVLPLARSRSMTINLVSVQALAVAPSPPAPKKIQRPPRRKPKPEPIRKPAPKPVAHRRPKPPPPLPEPAPAPPTAEPEPSPSPVAEQTPVDTDTAAQAEPRPVSRLEHGGVKSSVPLYDLNPPPVYPRVARRRNYQGTVLLDVRVTARGTVAEVKVAQSSGYSVLDRSALNSVRDWRFEPARRGTRPIETWVQVPVRFELQ